MIDIFVIFFLFLEQEFLVDLFYLVGKFYFIGYNFNYMDCIEVVNFVFDNDDGVCIYYYDKVDLILVGVLCCGKMFICLYMVLQYGICVVNYLLMEEDMECL